MIWRDKDKGASGDGLLARFRGLLASSSASMQLSVAINGIEAWRRVGAARNDQMVYSLTLGGWMACDVPRHSSLACRGFSALVCTSIPTFLTPCILDGGGGGMAKANRRCWTTSAGF